MNRQLVEPYPCLPLDSGAGLIEVQNRRARCCLRNLTCGLAAVSLLLAGACLPSENPPAPASSETAAASGDPTGLIWEAWGYISQSYSNWDNIDLERVQGEAILSLLELNETLPYPFLREVGRLRGQPPMGIPAQMADLWRALVLHQVRWPQVSPEEKAEDVIRAMVAGLGEPSAVVIPAENFHEARDALQKAQAGSYVGIGARVSRTGDQFTIEPFEDSWAEKAGIRLGDALVAVDRRPVTGRSLEELVELIAGPAGSNVQLSVERAGQEEPLEIQVVRDNIELQSVSRQLVPGGIGYIQVARFRDNTSQQFLKALEELDSFDMLALILDLRSSPGGSMEAAQEMAEHFLHKGTVFVSTEGRSAGKLVYVIEHKTARRPLEDLPMVVLINGQTQAEAEVLAGALQDSERALVLGTASFGQGSTNEFIEMSDGSAIYLPTSRWYRSSGEMMGSGGIQPDFYVPLEEVSQGFSRDSQFNQAYQILDDRLPPFR